MLVLAAHDTLDSLQSKTRTRGLPCKFRVQNIPQEWWRVDIDGATQVRKAVYYCIPAGPNKYACPMHTEVEANRDALRRRES